MRRALKRIAVIAATAAALGLAAGCAHGKAGEKESAAATTQTAAKNLKLYTLRVDGMRCGGCAKKVRAILESQKGVERVVRVDFKKGLALVVAPPGADVDAWAKAIAAVKKKDGKPHWTASLASVEDYDPAKSGGAETAAPCPCGKPSCDGDCGDKDKGGCPDKDDDEGCPDKGDCPDRDGE